MATIASPRDPSPSLRSPSLSGTPTSSVRPSLDIPRNGTGRATSPAPVAQRRNRAALRDYYNLKAKAQSGAAGSQNSDASESTITSSSTATAQTSTNADTSPLTIRLDEPSFDAETFVSDLLRTSSLRDVLRTESALVSEIRTLDGERKALVYDNYSKLIKAVGTIGDMQRGMQKNNNAIPSFGKAPANFSLDGVEVLEGKLQGLSEIVKELGLVNRPKPVDLPFSSHTKERRDKRKQRDLVRWVLNAPDRLETLLDSGNTKQAKAEWTTIQTLMSQWENVDGVEDVRKACAEAMQRQGPESPPPPNQESKE